MMDFWLQIIDFLNEVRLIYLRWWLNRCFLWLFKDNYLFFELFHLCLFCFYFICESSALLLPFPTFLFVLFIAMTESLLLTLPIFFFWVLSLNLNSELMTGVLFRFKLFLQCLYSAFIFLAWRLCLLELILQFLNAFLKFLYLALSFSQLCLFVSIFFLNYLETRPLAFLLVLQLLQSFLKFSYLPFFLLNLRLVSFTAVSLGAIDVFCLIFISQA